MVNWVLFFFSSSPSVREAGACAEGRMWMALKVEMTMMMMAMMDSKTEL